jgi:hypothetical protein
MKDLPGKAAYFIQNCGPIPKGTRASCIGVCVKRDIIILWLDSPILGVNQFGVSRRHMSKIKFF